MSEPKFFSTQSPLTFGKIVVLTDDEPRAGSDLGVRADHRARVDRRALTEARGRMNGPPAPAASPPPPPGVTGKNGCGRWTARGRMIREQ